MKTKNPYRAFPNYVLRTPLYSFNVYKKLTAEETISDEALKAICQEKAFMEALFLASPSLYDSMLKWLEQGIKDPKKDEKLKLSLLKYLSRMSTRCTPFGLFAGCTLGEFSDTTSIELSGIQENDRHTRLDMNFLVALAQDLAKIKEVSDQLLFYPNTSIYEAGEQLRYVEYRYINGRRQHSITGVENSYYLEGILTKAKEGCLLDTLAKTLVDEDISYEDAREFVDELVNSQLLISELEPSVSGREFMEHLQEVLAKIEGAEEILAALRRTSKSLQQLDQDVGNNPEMYLSIIESLKALGTKFEKKFMFQTDMSIAAKSNFLSKSLLQDLQQGFALLNKLTLPPSNRPIEGFREAYIERFETREMPLSKVLDTEIGIGYPHFRGAGDPNPLIDDIRLPLRRSKHVLKELNWTTLNSHLQKKLLDAKSKRDYSLHLTDQEFEGYEAKWNDLPDTMSFMLEVIQDGDQEKIRILGGFGISAANLLGRFCHSNTAIFEHVKRIVEREKAMNRNKLVAEIIHLPESRVGNIVMRPELREYEIPYLARSDKPSSEQLTLDDLQVSVERRQRIVLRSKTYNKEILPYLTNAHNYSNNALPIYHFLCDLQTQNRRGTVRFSWGPLADEYVFLPRVEYKNIILSAATWHLRNSHIKPLVTAVKTKDELKKELQKLRTEFQIPQFVLLVDGDNQLVINLENLSSVRMFVDMVKKRPLIVMSEFLFAKQGVVKHNEDYYTNQVIVAMYNDRKFRASTNQEEGNNT